MERQWSGNPRRLSQADLAEIERRIWAGETFATAAAAVGCSTRSIQRFLALSGGLKRRVKARSPLRLSLADREELSRGLVAGALPSKADLSLHSAAQLNAVARELNNRPRQTLNWMKPSEVFSRTVASIG